MSFPAKAGNPVTVSYTHLDVYKRQELISLPAAEQDAMLAKISSIGDDLSKDKPDLNKAVKLVFESAARNK